MTYNQLLSTLTTLLQSHAMIKTVLTNPPNNWLRRSEQPVYPVCCFTVLTGTANKGLEQEFNVQFWFLDKSGAENEFEDDVISDQMQIAIDIIELIRGTKRTYTIEDDVTINTISDKYEDFLAGTEFTTLITTQGSYDGCDVPTV